MKTVSINLYLFNELDKKAQDRAISQHEDFLIMSLANSDEIETEHKEGYSRKEVIESIEINDYLFFYDGEFAHCTTYTGKHEKAGITEFHFHGIAYTLPMGEGSLG